MSDSIALSEPMLNGREWTYVKECLDTGWISSAGKFVDKFEQEICALTKAKFAVAVSSGTSALQIALQVAGVKRDDEVIVPTVTFIAPVNAVRYLGAHPVFMDCDAYYNIDSAKTIEFLNKGTVVKNGLTVNKKTGRAIRAILPVHIFGNAVDLKDLLALCKKRQIKVAEDATESLGTVYLEKTLADKHTGTIGDLGCYSFNGNKIISAGGGGMIVTNDNAYAARARYLTTQAKDDSLYYIHHEVGYNYRLNNVQAAMGVAQLESLAQILRIKKNNYDFYKRRIDTIDGLQVAEVPSYASNNHWMYALTIDARKYGQTRDEVLKKFISNKIEARPLWYLNHWQKPYKNCQTYKIEAAEKLWDCTLNIPCSPGLSAGQRQKVIKLLEENNR